MSDGLAAVVVIAAAVFACWAAAGFPGLRTWRRCRCGTQYCTGCGTKRGK